MEMVTINNDKQSLNNVSLGKGTYDFQLCKCLRMQYR